MKRGDVLKVGDGVVGSAHALLDAPKEHVVGLRELLQDLQGLGVQLGQRALGVLEDVLHLFGHDTGVGQLALLISFAYRNYWRYQLYVYIYIYIYMYTVFKVFTTWYL